MFYYLTLFVIFVKCGQSKQIHLHDLQNSLNNWREETYVDNSFYTLPVDYSYYIVNVSLEEEDNSFILLQFDIKDVQDQIDYIKLSSYLDGKLERRLIINNANHKKTDFQIFSQHKTKYKIQIIGLMELQSNCFNKCNQHGVCKNQKCECFKGYYKDDCHMKVIKLNHSEKDNINVYDQIQYYVIETQEKNQKIQISFIIENYEELQLTFFNNIKQSYQQFSRENKKIINFLLDCNQAQLNNNLMIFAVQKSFNKNQYFLHHMTNKEGDKQNYDNEKEKEGLWDFITKHYKIIIAIFTAIAAIFSAGKCICNINICPKYGCCKCQSETLPE